jgi:dienelactone hydrolase
LLAGCLAGCTNGAERPDVRISPATSLYDAPVHMIVRGLAPDSTVTLALSATDGQGTVWRSSAVYRSSAAGTVDVATAAAVAGSYAGVDPMGLIDTMQPQPEQPTAFDWGGAPFSFRLDVAARGASVATGRFTRIDGPGVTYRNESLAATGFFGQYWTPPSLSGHRPAVLEFGGSEGGLDGQLVAGALAAAGYPVLDVAYFGEPGLAPALRNIPLEYFAGALRWLARQPGVAANRIFVAGASRGSEAALLLGVHYPQLVHGVIASTPSDLSFGSYPGPGNRPAWTFDGRPVPYSRTFSASHPIDDPAARIPVTSIRGPVFLDCGTQDRVWTSCPYAQTIQQELAGDRYPHVLYRYLGAGHFVNGLVPYEPRLLAPRYAEGLGDSVTANVDADARLWPHLLHFLAGVGVPTGTFTAPATPPPLPR